MRGVVVLLAFLSLSIFAPASAQDSPYAVNLHFTIVTGNDDLRGSGDNVYGVVDVAGTETRRILNLRGMRWADGSRHEVDIPLPAGFRLEDLRSIDLETTFGGGIGGDNWNMASVVVDVRPRSGGGLRLVVARNGPFRFTGDRRRLALTIRPEVPRDTRITK
jgi:hypothetical protein